MEDSLRFLLRALNRSGSTCRSRRRSLLHRRCVADRRRESAEKRVMDGRLIRRRGGGVPVNCSMMRWAHVDESRVHARVIRALQKLVPNGGDAGSLDRLFREAADYIACLRLQVKIMQAMVDVL